VPASSAGTQARDAAIGPVLAARRAMKAMIELQRAWRALDLLEPIAQRIACVHPRIKWCVHPRIK
jgi:hypothetical protein